MAAHITHIALAERAFDKYFYKFNRKDFFVGTMFPDIRMLGHIPREMTHFQKISMDHVLEEKNSFLAGMLYHSLIDKIREEWMVGHGIYDDMPYEYRWTQAIKLYEDRLYYNDIPNWETIENYFTKVIPDELKFKMTEEQVMRWHKLLIDFFKTGSTPESIIKSCVEMGMEEQAAIDINLHIEVIEKNKNITKLCQEFHDNFEAVLKEAI